MDRQTIIRLTASVCDLDLEFNSVVGRLTTRALLSERFTHAFRSPIFNLGSYLWRWAMKYSHQKNGLNRSV